MSQSGYSTLQISQIFEIYKIVFTDLNHSFAAITIP